MSDSDKAKLANLFHLARTALADDPERRHSRYHHKLWAAAAFAKETGIDEVTAYKELCQQEAWRYTN